MQWLSALENRLQWIAFPGLFKYLTLLGVVIFAWQWVDPSVVERISFDRDKILSGEVWRIISFAFAPAGTFSFGVFGVLFLFFAVMIAFLINDSLEEVWGPTRTTLYLLTSLVGLVIGMFLFDPGPLPAGRYLYTSMFLAFATYFPNYEFRLFFFIPVKVRYLGWFALGMMIFSGFAAPVMFCVIIPTLIPYAIWVLPAEIQGKAALASATKRRQKFKSTQITENEPFNTCSKCHRTDLSDPDLQFRTMLDGTEYCVDHLPEETSQADKSTDHQR
ncbi:hypothetical protein [Haloferula sp.]|uniref:hypothetical protein n=1 Tax=Haloferula sp. TaxID=2497595 RepID=UPI003C72BF7A